MEYGGYVAKENDEWVLKIHEGDGCFTTFFKNENLKTYKKLIEKISQISEEMGWYEVQYNKNEDGVMCVTIFYDTVEGD